MTGQGRDRLTGGVLLVFAGLWTWTAATTVPDVGSGPVGPRGFPLGLGLILAALSLVLIGSSFWRSRPEAHDDAEGSDIPLSTEVWAVGSAFAMLAGYAVLLNLAGFLIATVVIVALALILVLRKRNPFLVGGLALGTALCVFVVFNKILGVYLPHGRWVDFWF